MKATELMIGNIVEVNGGPQRIRQVSRRKIGYCPLGSPTRSYARVNEINPIPITEELLVRNGFDKIGLGLFRRESADGNIVLRESDGIWEVNSSMIDISYLHQLQNLLNIMDIKLDFVV